MEHHPDHYQKRATRFVNLFSLVMMTGLLIGFTNVFFLQEHYPYLNELFAFCLCVCCIVLNRYGFFTLSTYLFLVTLNSSIFFINEYYDISTASYLFYFPVILCVALLHNPLRGIKHTLLLFLISFLFMGLSIFFDFDFIRNHNVSTQNNELLFRYNLSIAIVVSTMMVVLVIQVIDSQNFQLMRALKEGQDQQEKISQALREKEVMLSELHHRVKNNLSVISSLLNLQMGSTDNEEAKRILADSRNRVASMSLVHEKLYRKKDFSQIDFHQYVQELVTELVRASPDRISAGFELEPLLLDISLAIPIGLIINEMVTNSIKHAFKGLGTEARVHIRLYHKNEMCCLEIRDNGQGFDYDTALSAGASLGLSLMESLVDQVDGQLKYSRNGGSCYLLSFKTV